MSDKKQFTFEDDASSETDLSATFAEGEHSLETPEPDVQVKKGGNPRTRLLLLLLLVAAAGGGIYYFMGLGGAPAVPTVAATAPTTVQSVSLPVPPAQQAVAPSQAEPAVNPDTLAVPPPSAVGATEVSASPVPSAVAVAPPPVGLTQPAEASVQGDEPAAAAVAGSADKPVAEPPSHLSAEAGQPQPVPPEPSNSLAGAPAVVPATKVASAPEPAGGAFVLDAGSFLLEANRDALVADIKKLGYEPLVTPVEATLEMTRVRLGTFDKDSVQEALAFAQAIEPGAYSAPAGDRYVIYAGTFLKSESVARLRERFLAEGINIHPEPVQVVRTLNRVRFGSFATREAAEAAASEVGQAGLKVAVVKAR